MTLLPSIKKRAEEIADSIDIPYKSAVCKQITSAILDSVREALEGCLKIGLDEMNYIGSMLEKEGEFPKAYVDGLYREALEYRKKIEALAASLDSEKGNDNG